MEGVKVRDCLLSQGMSKVATYPVWSPEGWDVKAVVFEARINLEQSWYSDPLACVWTNWQEVVWISSADFFPEVLSLAVKKWSTICLYLGDEE